MSKLSISSIMMNFHQKFYRFRLNYSSLIKIGEISDVLRLSGSIATSSFSRLLNFLKFPLQSNDIRKDPVRYTK